MTAAQVRIAGEPTDAAIWRMKSVLSHVHRAIAEESGVVRNRY